MSDEPANNGAGKGNAGGMTAPQSEEEAVLRNLKSAAEVDSDGLSEEAALLNSLQADAPVESENLSQEAAALGNLQRMEAEAERAREEEATTAKLADAFAAPDVPAPKQDEEPEELDEEEREALEARASETRLRVFDDDIKRRWYAIHAHSGQESNVRKSLQAVAEQTGLGDVLANVLVPMEEVAEIKSGQKRVSKRKYFPGYVLVQLPEHPERNAELWHLIKNTSGVTGFIGSRTVPVPLEDAEVNAILEEIRGERERPKPKVKFESGERVKIIDGPFSNFMGNIDEINLERGRLKVMVEIFERLTSVEVEFWQVERL